MQTRTMQWTVAIAIALIVSVAFVAPTQAQDPFPQPFKISQTPGVSASGTVTFTKDGKPLRTFEVHCPGGYGDFNVYVFHLPDKPNDIEWDIDITWKPGDVENWKGADNNFGPGWSATKTPGPGHDPPGDPPEVRLEDLSTVGGVDVPLDKLGLLAPYAGLASLGLVAAVTAFVHATRRKKKQ